MQLIGMLDSPYVRRVAIALQLLGIPFEHRSLSVFRQYSVSLVYELQLRPAERQHAPWIERLTQQLLLGLVPVADHPSLRDFSAQAEALAPFRRAAHGAATYR
jgi:hypothetical protein